MNKIILCFCLHFFFNSTAQSIQLKIVQNPWHASYTTLVKLTSQSHSPILKSRLQRSIYNRPSIHQAIKTFELLNLHYGFSYDQFPPDGKLPFSTAESLERNLIFSKTLAEFESLSYGLLAPEDLKTLVNLLDSIKPLYKALVLDTLGELFGKTVDDLQKYLDQHQTNQIVDQVVNFYGSSYAMPKEVLVAVYPSLVKSSFSAKAFLNAAVCEVPTGFKSNATLLSVLLHEVFHVMFDAQPLALKLNIDQWFNQSPYASAVYAKQLLNEALATALGNGYAYKCFTGYMDTLDWYHDTYINRMARHLYPLLLTYIERASCIDSNFIANYCEGFEKLSSNWLVDINFLLKYRYVLASQNGSAEFFRTLVPYASMVIESWPLTPSELSGQAASKLTKVVVIEENHEKQIKWLYQCYPELKKSKIKIRTDGYRLVGLKDGTQLMIYTPKKLRLEDLIK